MSRQLLLISALGAVLVIALWWLFLYSPGNDDLTRIEEEVAAAEAEQGSLQQRIAVLENVRARAPETEAAIARVRAIVPSDPALPAALRQLAAAADDAGVELTAVNTTRPDVVDEVVGLNAATVTITASGSYFQLVDFIRRVEDPSITARGIAFNNLAVTVAEHPTLTISLTGDMFAVLDPPPVPEDPAAPAPEDETADEAAGTADDTEEEAA